MSIPQFRRAARWVARSAAELKDLRSPCRDGYAAAGVVVVKSKQAVKLHAAQDVAYERRARLHADFTAAAHDRAAQADQSAEQQTGDHRQPAEVEVDRLRALCNQFVERGLDVVDLEAEVAAQANNPRVAGFADRNDRLSVRCAK
jgi:hypothetical protein